MRGYNAILNECHSRGGVMMQKEEKLYFVADETSAPYEDWENPFVRDEDDDAFDLKVAEKFGMVIE